MQLPVIAQELGLTLPTIPLPEKYSGKPAQCRGFLLQCHLYFAAFEGTPELENINNFMGFLTGEALRCATAVRENSTEAFGSYEQFVSKFK